jgi:putative tryptophan/tyrosine transport system substrate-binding protein
MAYRSVQDRAERLPDLAAELIQLQVHVMVTRGGTAVIRAAQQATSTIPIVMVSTPDPIGAGFVASLASPGENITGTTSIDMELAGKRLELLKEAVRQASRVAVPLNRTNPPAISQLRETQVAAQTFRPPAPPGVPPGECRRRTGHCDRDRLW